MPDVQLALRRRYDDRLGACHALDHTQNGADATIAGNDLARAGQDEGEAARPAPGRADCNHHAILDADHVVAKTELTRAIDERPAQEFPRAARPGTANRKSNAAEAEL